MASDERVTLNVGGTRFEIPRKTLGRFPESLLGPLSDPEASHELQHEANDVYFFDRNGRFFEFILEYYRSGIVAPPSDLTRQQVLAELQYWGLPTEPYLRAVEEESRVRNYVEPPVELPLDQLPTAEILEQLAEMTPPERLRTNFEFVRHTDTDLIAVGLTDLEVVHGMMSANEQLRGSEPHVEVLSMLALGNYRLGRLSSSRQFVALLKEFDPENRQARDLQTLLNDTSLNYSRLGLLAVGITLVGLAAVRAWTWSSSSSKSRK